MAARLAFCNDLDFASWDTYQEVHHILREEFGLTTGDSFWLFDPAGSDMALFKGSLQEKGRYHDELLADIQSGRLDVMHSIGNFSLTNTDCRPNRELLDEGLAYLAEHSKVPQIWTNHGDHGDICNIGGGHPQYQQGDLPGSPAYVLDILLRHGVKYFWLDHHSTNDFVFSSSQQGDQPLLVREMSRSGFPVTCFRRYRGALPKAPTALTLHEQLTDENLNQLIAKQGVCVVYQHWGAHREGLGQAYTAKTPVFPPEGHRQLKRLSELVSAGRIQCENLGSLLDRCEAPNEVTLPYADVCKSTL